MHLVLGTSFTWTVSPKSKEELGLGLDLGPTLNCRNGFDVCRLILQVFVHVLATLISKFGPHFTMKTHVTRGSFALSCSTGSLVGDKPNL
jgi:hypothetical protein